MKKKNHSIGLFLHFSFAQKNKVFLAAFGITIFLLGITIFLYGYVYERNKIVLEQISINVQSAPPELKDIKMIQFSDLHFKNLGSREIKLRKMINKIKPDIIFFTGDLLDQRIKPENHIVIDNAIQFLGSLFYKKYFFFVFGEYGYYFRDYLKERLGKIGIYVLDNESYSIDLGKIKLNVIGITDDPKDLDAFYNDDRYHRKYIKRFQDFIKSPKLNDYLNIKYYIGGQYTIKWEDYEITGKIKILPDQEKAGIAFYSQFPMGIYKSYFLELDREKRAFCVDSSEKYVLKGKRCFESKFKGLNWYWFRINIKNLSGMTRIRAKIWELGDDPPNKWQIECYDNEKSRSSQGTIGLYPIKRIIDDRFSDVSVRMLDYDNAIDMVREVRQGVKEVPPIEKNLWMTLDEIKNLILRKQKTDEQFLLEKRLEKIITKFSSNGISILLSHSPEGIKIVKNKGIDLVLSGDTHGGQIDIPLIDKYRFDSYDGKLLKSGLSYFNGTYLYINRGVGTSIIPVRLNCRPEVTLLTLN